MRITLPRTVKFFILLVACVAFWVVFAVDLHLWIWIVIVLAVLSTYRSVRRAIWSIRQHRYFTLTRVCGQQYALIGLFIIMFAIRDMRLSTNESAIQSSLDTGFQVFMQGNTIAMIGIAGHLITNLLTGYLPVRLMDLLHFIENPEDLSSDDE